MKRSSLAALGFGLALAGCGPERQAPDPCAKETFDQQACEQAIRDRGYYSYGHWVPMSYSHPYPYYYGQYGSYISNGGARPAAPPPAAYAKPAPSGSGSAPAASSISRGGFGSTGEAGVGE